MTEGILERGRPFELTAPLTEPSSIRSVSRALRRNQAQAYRRACLRAFGRSAQRPFIVLMLWFSAVLMPVRLTSERAFVMFVSAALSAGRVIGRSAVSTAVTASDTSLKLRLYRVKHPAKRATMAIMLSAAVAVTFLSSFYSIGLEVTLGGRSIGYIGNQSEFEAAVASVSARASEILQRPYLLNPDVSYKFSLVTRNELFNRGEVETQLFNQIKEVKNLYVLTVDGQAVGGTQSGVALQNMLDGLLSKYPKESYADKASFVRDVQISEQLVAASVERTPDEMSALLNSTVREEINYTVAEGDTWESIAAGHGMNADTLIAQNDLDGEEAPQIGTRLLINSAAPFLSIESVKRIYYTEPLAFETETVPEPNLYIGQSEVRVNGVDGEVQVMADVSYIDGRAVGQTEAGRVVLTQPVTKVVAEGSTERPPKYPTGTFIKPYNGMLTSGFGNRKLFGSWANHTGIDLAGPTGSGIVASDGGTVTFAGVKNGYGKTVIITHLDGLSTLYGHCSALLVKEGQKVGQGEKIAKVGNTGRSTGSHLHFEVRVNGTPVNPWKYLK